MSNRLLSLLILVVIFGGIYLAYWYFFIANVGGISVVVTGVGSGTVSIRMTSELRQSYDRECGRVCGWTDMPPVKYRLHAERDGFVSVDKEFSVRRGETTKLIVRMDPEVSLTPIETTKTTTESGSNDASGTTTLPQAEKILTIASGPIEAIDGEPIRIPGTIYAVKETENPTVRLVTTDRGVYAYSITDKSAKENPLYDDLLPLPSGDLIALIRKTSKTKLGLLNLDSTGDDYILRINIEKRSRTVLLRTKEDGKYLDRADNKIILVTADGKQYEVRNAE